MPVDMEMFRGVTGAARDALLAKGQRAHYGAGDILFHQGDASTGLLLIIEGKVKISRVAPDGSSITLTVVGPGEPIGTLHAAYEMPHTATATALVPTEILCWAIADIRQIMQGDAALTANVLAVVARYAALMIERLEEVATISVESRIARALCRAAGKGGMPKDGTDLPLSRQDIADMASTTLPTASRIMSRWRERGWISGHRGRVRILDAQALRTVAGWSG